MKLPSATRTVARLMVVSLLLTNILLPHDRADAEEDPAAPVEPVAEGSADEAETPVENAEDPTDAPEPAEHDIVADLKRQIADGRRKLEENLAAQRARVAELTRTSGPESGETLAARRKLANLLTVLVFWDGGAAGFRKEQEERRTILAIVRRVHGHDDPATFADWEALATAYHLAGDYGEAEKEYRGLIAAMGKALGPEDPKTLLCRQALAFCLYGHKQYAESEREYRALIAIREGNPDLPRNFPDTQVNFLFDHRLTLGLLLQEAGKPAEAEAEYRAVLPALEKDQGPEGGGTLNARFELGKCLLAQGKAAAAVAEFALCHAGREKTFGTENSRTQRAARLLAEAREAAAEAEPGNPAPSPAKPE